MALELFKPFIIRELMKRQALTLKAAKRMLERAKPEIWDILEQVTRDIPIMLNRAPTLHRLGVQAFMPVLIEGKSIQLHPLTCSAFNADFDGDQMAVHVPLSLEAQLEAKLLMMATNNILSPASGKPIAVPSQDMILGVAYMTKAKDGVEGEGRYFSTREEVVSAYQNESISLHAKIKVAGINKLLEDGLEEAGQRAPIKWKDWTTVGRVLFNHVLPVELGYINVGITKKEIAGLVDRCYRELGSFKTAAFLDAVKKLGYTYATKAGLSISVQDFHIPLQKLDIVKRAQAQVKEIAKQAKMGIITDSERYNKIIDLWTHVTDEVSDHMFDQMQKQDAAPYKDGVKKFNPVFLMADSGARGSRQQIRQLGGMRGLMQKPQKKLTGAVGEIIENPVIANFREGLSVLEYFISTHGGRKGLADTALKTADAGYLTRRLIDVAHDIVVTEEDCETINGVSVGTLKSGEDVIELMEERILGRVCLDNIVDPLTDEAIVKTGEMISADQAKKLAKAGIDRVRIRSVLTCEAKVGACAQCYGLNLATGRRVEIGEAVGIIAAQSIGEPGTQLTLRTFHIGGTASRVIQRSQIVAKESGVVRFHGIRTLTNREGNEICVSRNGFLSIREPGGQERSHYEIRYGARLKTTEGKRVEKGELLVEWDPYSLPIISEEEGTVKLEDVVEGVTLHEEKNRITGLIERVIIEHRVEALHPQVTIIGKSGKVVAQYPLPIDTNLVVQDGDKVKQADIVAKIPQEISKSKDITGGLPRVAELFEARKPKSPSIISEIEGTVKLAPTPKGGLKVIVTNEETGLQRDYAVPQGKHLVVYEGDRVGVGEPLVDGAVNPHDILKVKGAKEVQEFLVNEIQEVYRLQGVIINDKHIEVIVRRMLSNVIITKSGETDCLIGEVVPRNKFLEANRKAKKGEQAEAQPVLLGITKASLSSESFISAASFQETTRVLVEAATTGAVDNLKGLKENVIIGHLIPAGTGFYERGLIEKSLEEAKKS
jgi:DNA-directed RNA polymerase subunit beta'